jgi:multidrug efflux system outer membrane protein
MQSARLVAQADVAQSHCAAGARHRARTCATRPRRTATRCCWWSDAGAQARAELEAARARTEPASTEPEALRPGKRRAVLEHAIAVLVGEAASRFAIEAPWLRPPVVPPGAPSTVRRGVLMSRQRWASCMAQLRRRGAAAWFPSGADRPGGFAWADLSDAAGRRERALGALLALPVFDRRPAAGGVVVPWRGARPGAGGVSRDGARRLLPRGRGRAETRACSPGRRMRSRGPSSRRRGRRRCRNRAIATGW